MERKFHAWMWCSTLLACLWVMACPVYTMATSTVPLQLDSLERAWLSKQTQINIGVMDDWPPMNYVAEDGTVTGLGVAYLHALNERLGGIINIVPASFSENTQAVKDKKLDALMDITPKQERTLFFNFTPAYMTIPQVIVAAKTQPYLQSEKDLNGKTVALERGYYTIKRFERDYPAIKIHEYLTTSDCLDAVARGEVDAYVGNRAVAMFLIEKELMANLVLMGRTSEPPVSLTIGTHKDNKLLAAILTKALKSLTLEERHRIHNKWLATIRREGAKFALSPAEQLWLQQHPHIRFGIGQSWAPFVIRTASGHIEGFEVEWLDKINNLLGANIELVPGPWHKIVKQAELGELDGLAQSAVIEDRREIFNFTDSYLSQYYALATTHELKNNIRSKDDISNKTIAFVKGNAWVAKLIQSIRGVTCLETESETEAFNLVLEGKADAAFITLGMYSELRKSYFDSLAIAYVFSRHKLDLVYSVRKDWPELVSILNKAMAALGDETKQSLIDKWIGYQADELTAPLALSKDELAWLGLELPVSVRVEDAPPFFFMGEDALPRGIALDYLNYIAQRTGITFKYLTDPQPLQQPDLSTVWTPTVEQESQFLFSQPYYSSPRVIFSRQDSGNIVGIEALSGKTMAVVKDSRDHSELQKKYPQIKLQLVASAKQGLQAVATAQADAFIGNLTVCNYLLDREGYTNLKVASPSPFPTSQLAFSIRNDWPQLTRIINKVLEDMPEQERLAIHKNYLNFNYDYGISRAEFKKVAAIVVLAVSVVIGLFVLWNRSLSRQVQARTLQLEGVNHHLLLEMQERQNAEKKHDVLEAQLRQKVKAEAVGVLAAGIAHNFNNNLSIILGNIELSKMKLPEESTIGTLLDNARIAVLRARDLVQQILTYSREGKNNQKPVVLYLVLDETIKLLQSTMPTTVTLQLEVSEESKDCTVKADAGQIQELLINLCNNAVQAMEEKGILQIEFKAVTLNPEDIPAGNSCSAGQYISLSVQDNGSGIDPKVMDNIFDPFFTTKAVGEGTGLGLSTVYGIVEQHHAFLQVASELGHGTTFTVYLPIIASQSATTEIPEFKQVNGDAKILLVDDDEMLVDIWGKMLQEAGYEVTTETSSQRALALFSATPERFDLLITDQTMPELDGKELIQEVIKIRPELPTIICTGYSSKISAEDYQDYGVTGYCMKPIDLAQLLSKIALVLHGADKKSVQG